MPNEKQPFDHDDLVRMMAEWLVHNLYMVVTTLDTEEHRRPLPLNDFRPDVYATKTGSRSVIGIAEPCENLHKEETEKRWKGLFAAVDRPNIHLGYELHIIVPTTCLDEAQRKAEVWGIAATFHTENPADKIALEDGE